MEDSKHFMSNISPRKALEEILNNHKSINGKTIAERFDLVLDSEPSGNFEQILKDAANGPFAGFLNYRDRKITGE